LIDAVFLIQKQTANFCNHWPLRWLAWPGSPSKVILWSNAASLALVKDSSASVDPCLAWSAPI